MPQLVLLVGPKGVGKTRIATMLAEVFGAYAVPVEAMWRARIADVPRAEAEDASWERDGFEQLADHALEALARHAIVVLDTTGTSEHTPAFVARLSRSGALRVVRVEAPEATCNERALARDGRDQIPVSRERLEEINALASRVSLPAEATFDNAGPWRELEVRAWFHDLLVAKDASVRATIPTLETERLVLRRWEPSDRAPFAALNADPVVMEHFPAPLTTEQSDAFADRIARELDRRGTGLFAVSTRSSGAHEFLGFCGLSVPTFEAPFLPAVEIGWRLARSVWGRGLATEAARAVLTHGFAIGLPEIVSFTSPRNTRSLRVMEKLGMTRDRAADFEHPRVPEGHSLRPHVLYRLRAPAPDLASR